MNSRESVKELYKEREYLLADKVHNKSETWHNDITHYDNINHCLLTINKDLDRLEELEKENELLKKALEVLEIITKNKKFIDVCYGASGNKIIVENYQFSVSAMQKEDFRKVKEWLENGK